MKISSFSVIITFVAIAILGMALVPRLPVKLVPSASLPSISVSYSMPGASARTVESEATSLLEGSLARVRGVRNVKSRSSNGSGSISLDFDRNTDMETARFEVSMTLRQLWGKLPHNIGYPRVSMQQVHDRSSRPFMSYTINAGQSPAEIMRYAELNIAPALSRIAGVANVELTGATPMQWVVEYDSHALAQYGVGPDDIIRAINEYTGSEFLGLATPVAGADRGWVPIALNNRTESADLDISDIVVTTNHGNIITLDKLARLRHAEEPPTGYFRINGLNSIYLNVTAADDANQIDLSEVVKSALGSISLPPGYMINLSYDASERIACELDTIYFRSCLTVLILLAFVALITLSWRYLLLITISLAINLAIAVVAYYFLQVEIQLYSLAGITISLNLIIDNLIVMTEHVTRHRNLRAFTAVLAATLTTIGALAVVFFLDEETMLSLKDFVIVVIVNLAVSLLVALWLVPALAERLGVRVRRGQVRVRRLSARARKVYMWCVRGFLRYRVVVAVMFVLAFAGSLYIFVEKVYNGNYWGRTESEPMLTIGATLPNGATLGQMNALVMKMESYLAAQSSIRQFQTSVSGARRARIDVYFKPENMRDGSPYRLKSDVIRKALTLGGGSWSVYGLEDLGFNNDVSESAGNYRIKLYGYNYDDLYRHAEALRDTLLNYRRIKEVNINSEFSYYKDDYTEFYLELDKQRLALDSISVGQLFAALKRDLGSDLVAGQISTPSGSETVVLRSDQTGRDVWGLMNLPIDIGRKSIKLSDFAKIDQEQAPADVVKENQEYVLCLQYDYIGSLNQGNKLRDRVIEQFNKALPDGYGAETSNYTWHKKDEWKRYLLLGLVAVIIFFLSSILFNSLKQPLAIIAVIPVSFIGVFLTFYLFGLSFDEGGFAAFILLCGVTVNAAIYILNEYNALRARCRPLSAYDGLTRKVRRQSPIDERNSVARLKLRLYMKAFSVKITAVMLTVLSTVLGFIPFLIGDTQQGFWFPLAAGTMGGLVFSLSAIFVLLPILALPRIIHKQGKKIKNKKVTKTL